MNENIITNITNYFLEEKDSIWRVFDVLAEEDGIVVLLKSEKLYMVDTMDHFEIRKSYKNLSNSDIKQAVMKLKEGQELEAAY